MTDDPLTLPDRDDLEDAVGYPAALARALQIRPTAAAVPDPKVLALLQRAHDVEDAAICRAIGLDLHPHEVDADPICRAQFALVAALERRVLDLTARRAA